MAIILGIDPGSRTTGYGLLEMENLKIKYLASGSIVLSDLDFKKRLLVLNESLGQLIREYTPNQAAIEQVFVGKNASSALKLGHARGVALLAITQANLTVSEYSAKVVKKAVTGSGGANKKQVQTMIAHILKLRNIPPPDASDALAIALCHGYSDNKTQLLR